MSNARSGLIFKNIQLFLCGLGKKEQANTGLIVCFPHKCTWNPIFASALYRVKFQAIEYIEQIN